MKIILIHLLCLTALYGQIDTTNFFSIKFGCAFSHIEGAEVKNAGNINNPASHAGLYCGINFQRYINEQNAQQYEIYYMQKGSKWGKPLFPIFFDGDYAIYDLSFVGISLLYNFKSRIGNLFKEFNTCFGIYYEYNLSANQSWTVEDHPTSDFHQKDFRNEINKNQWGIILGAKFPFFFDNTFLSLLWHNSFTDLYNIDKVKYAEYDFFDKEDLKNRTFSLTIEYQLH